MRAVLTVAVRVPVLLPPAAAGVGLLAFLERKNGTACSFRWFIVLKALFADLLWEKNTADKSKRTGWKWPVLATAVQLPPTSHVSIFVLRGDRESKLWRLGEGNCEDPDLRNEWESN
jgi:hypothetical protein